MKKLYSSGTEIKVNGASGTYIKNLGFDKKLGKIVHLVDIPAWHHGDFDPDTTYAIETDKIELAKGGT